jgi:hypothetical protein
MYGNILGWVKVIIIIYLCPQSDNINEYDGWVKKLELIWKSGFGLNVVSSEIEENILKLEEKLKKMKELDSFLRG